MAKRTRSTSTSDKTEKAKDSGELYMLVERKDASLTDAERECLIALHISLSGDTNRRRQGFCEIETRACAVAIKLQ